MQQKDELFFMHC